MQRLFQPGILVLKSVSAGVKNTLLLLYALSLIVSFSLYHFYFGLHNSFYHYLMLVALLIWVYFYIANMYAIAASVKALKKILSSVNKGDYSVRMNDLAASEFRTFKDDGNTTLAMLEDKTTFLEEYKRVVDASSPLVKTDVNGIITYVNHAYEKLSGYTLEELQGNSHALIRSEGTSDAYLEAFWSTILNKEVFKGEFANRDKSGKTFYVESTVIPILDARGEIDEFISIMFDVTKRKEQEQELEHKLYIDTLTGLPNRTALHQDVTLHYAQKLILINIDDFNTINTIYGEDIGDEVLVELARTLQATLSPNFTLYRHSGDEFAILANENIAVDIFKEHTIVMAHQLNPMELHCINHDITIRARMGAAIGLKRGNPRSLVSMASLALREAKRSKQAYAFYSQLVDDVLHLEANLLTLEMLEEALDKSGVHVHFQAIANTKSHEVEKFEALVRIVDARGNMHYPNEFINVAKGARLYSRLSKEIFRQTLDVAEKNPSYDFSFNIEITDILDPRTSRYILTRLRESNCAERIVFELVESEDLEGNEQVYHFFTLVKKEGSKIAIDDFGSGYSNYAYLMRLGVDIVKIDGSLVSDITTNLNNKRIVKSIINIIHELGMKVVTEYIEDKETYQMVLLLGADYAQGHFIEKATGIDVETLLAR